jgi:hypothetical protein
MLIINEMNVLRKNLQVNGFLNYLFLDKKAFISLSLVARPNIRCRRILKLPVKFLCFRKKGAMYGFLNS